MTDFNGAGMLGFDDESHLEQQISWWRTLREGLSNIDLTDGLTLSDEEDLEFQFNQATGLASWLRKFADDIDSEIARMRQAISDLDDDDR